MCEFIFGEDKLFVVEGMIVNVKVRDMRNSILFCVGVVVGGLGSDMFVVNMMWCVDGNWVMEEVKLREMIKWMW